MSNLAIFEFPSEFLWGTATSSHQVEGGQTNNDWWVMEQLGEYIYRDQRAGDACDWWRQAELDFDRMAAMRQNSHRLSLEWSRIQPQPDTWSEEALLRYREMLEGLRDRGIQPMVTLHHFTNPLWMAVLGGWEHPKSPKWFEAYVRKVVSALGDLVDLWCTINEPMVLLSQGYLIGKWPPNKISISALYQAGLNLVRAHAAAYHAIHEMNPDAKVGLAKHMIVWSPHRTWIPTDHLVARFVNRITNHLILDALTKGYVRMFGKRFVQLDNAANTLDWIGINYYQRFRVGMKIRNLIRLILPSLPAEIFYQGTDPTYQKGPGGWGEIHAEGLFDTLRSVAKYGLPIYITENGIPDEDDSNRPRFILTHLHQLWRAIQLGIPVRGYYHWSLVDNFEWSEGYNPEFRFGLLGVDFKTQERTLRTSGELYAQVCRQNGIGRELVRQCDPELIPQLFPSSPALQEIEQTGSTQGKRKSPEQRGN
jgi:beta-glucosidase